MKGLRFGLLGFRVEVPGFRVLGLGRKRLVG